MNISTSIPDASVGAIARAVTIHRHLLWQLTKREVAARYRGSLFGLAWSFFNPLLMLAVYSFVFGTVFRMRWGAGVEPGGVGFPLTLFAGLLVHAAFAECLNRAPGVILSNPSYVKRVVFPLELMGIVTVLSALFHAGISLLLLFTGLLLSQGSLPATVLWVPVVLVPLALVSLGVVWWLSAMGVYLRDIGQATGVLSTVLLFLAPILYPMSAIPERFRGWIYLNPLTFLVEQFRGITVAGQFPDLLGLAAYSAVAALFAYSGFWWFQRSRRGFADVL